MFATSCPLVSPCFSTSHCSTGRKLSESGTTMIFCAWPYFHILRFFSATSESTSVPTVYRKRGDSQYPTTIYYVARANRSIDMMHDSFVGERT